MTRRPLFVLALLVACGLAAPAAAQTGRATGIVRDTNGHPIRSAIVRAVNPNAHPSEVQSASDDKGRWGMIGLMSGEWTFTVEAPGYVTGSVKIPVRTAPSAPMTFTLVHDPGPLPGALDKNIQQAITEANALRDQGRVDQAIAAYDEIRSKNPRLTTIHLVLAEAYRAKAAQERDAATRQTLLARALNAYNEVLKTDTGNERAQAGIAAVRADAGDGARPLR